MSHCCTKAGTYACSFRVRLPWKEVLPWEHPIKAKSKYVNIDKCLLYEVYYLWTLGIKTTGCCCGHGYLKPYIGVYNEHIPTMLKLGYKVQYNSCRPNDNDVFCPKSKIKYIEEQK